MRRRITRHSERFQSNESSTQNAARFIIKKFEAFSSSISQKKNITEEESQSFTDDITSSLKDSDKKLYLMVKRLEN